MLRQPLRHAVNRISHQRAAGVVGLVAAWEVDNLFGIPGTVSRGNNRCISEDVVVITRRHGTGVTEVVYLHGRASRCEKPGTGVAGIALEVHGDINAPLSRKRRHLQVGHVVDINETVERPGNSLAHGVRGDGAKPEAIALETRRIVRLQRLQQQVRGGVFAKIRGVVTHAYAPIRSRRRKLTQRGRARVARLCVTRRRLLLQRG